MKATAVANANIALVKYWGNRDTRLILPYNSSVSMTCDGLQTKTTVEFSGSFGADMLTINNEESVADSRFLEHIDVIRRMAGISEKARVVSATNFPVAAGLASSASGYAALTMAASKAAGLELTEKELTMIARLGSGSASRSIPEGFVFWNKGIQQDGKDCYSESIAKKTHWPDFRMIACVVSEEKKSVGSRDGMKRSVESSPYFSSWVSAAEEDAKKVREAIKKRDFSEVCSIAEFNALRMHSVMFTTQPSLIYWNPGTLAIMKFVLELRHSGTEAYFTMDAGPQVKVLCLEKDAIELEERLKSLDAVKRTILCRPGDRAALTDDHMF